MFKKRISQGDHLSIRMWLVLGMFLTIVTIPMIGSVLSVRAAPTTEACGPIASDTTWLAASSPYTVTCDVQVMNGVTLTIQSGATVKFNSGTSLRVDGTLIARGCTFTSNKASPARDDWGRIFFGPMSVDAAFDAGGNYVSGSIIQDCLVEWAGGGAGVNGGIEINLAAPFIDHNAIRNNGASGIYATGRSASQPVVIRRNSVSDNIPGHIGGGIYVSAGRVISNTVSNNIGFNGGGGIYAIASTVIGNSIIANSATNASNGGGLYAVGSTLTGNTVSGNTATNDGGGLYADGGTVSGNTVSGNTASRNGGGIFASVSLVTGNTVNDNSAHGSNFVFGGGGGIFASGATVVSNTISGNAATNGDGGGVHARTSTVQQNTLTNNSASKQGGAIYADGGTVSANTVLTNTTTQNGTIYMNGGTATQNIVQKNVAGNGGGGMYGANANLTNNTVQNNTANFGGGIYATQSTVRANTVMSNAAQSDGGGIWADRGTVSQNTIVYNSVPAFGRGTGAYLSGAADFSYNKVASNTASGGTVGGVTISGTVQIHYNNLYDNQPYDAEVVSSSNVSGTLNYWGPSACTAIPGQIYDGNDMPGRGQLLYAPSLYAPAPLTQLSVPTNLTLITGMSAVTLTWTPIPAIPNVGCHNPGAADAGYRIYYAVGSSCPPFNGKGLPQGDSPIDVGDVTAISLSGLSGNEYSFVVTARDYLGRESGYSNLVVGSLGQWKIYLPLVLKAS